VIPSQEADNTKGEGRHACDATAHHWTRSEPVPPRDGQNAFFTGFSHGGRGCAHRPCWVISHRSACLMSLTPVGLGSRAFQASDEQTGEQSNIAIQYWIRTSFRSPPLAFLYLGVVQTDEAGLTDTHFLLVTRRS
jgi:hypothetical protein